MYSTNVSCFGVPPKGFQDQQLSSNSSNVQVKTSIQNHLVAIYQHLLTMREAIGNFTHSSDV